MSYGKDRPYKSLKILGCLAKVAVSNPRKVKIGPKTIECIYIGYASNSSAYQFLVHKLENVDVHENSVIESRMHHSLRMCFHVK